MGQWLEKFPEQIELVLSNNDDMALGLLIRCAAWALSGRCVWQGLTALRLDWMQWSLVLCLEQW